MHERDIGIAALSNGERLSGTHGGGLDLVPGLLLEVRHEDVQQARVLSARGRREQEVGIGRCPGRGCARRRESSATGGEDEGEREETLHGIRTFPASARS